MGRGRSSNRLCVIAKQWAVHRLPAWLVTDRVEITVDELPGRPPLPTLHSCHECFHRFFISTQPRQQAGLPEGQSVVFIRVRVSSALSDLQRRLVVGLAV